ncbi:MAG: polymerase ECF-type sigma factor [Segetibacter sp.]|nr:polymerase ECF-type sigma factor [Segetibacter sp.]
MNLKQTYDQDNDSGNNIKIDDQDFETFFKNNFIQLCAFCQYKYGFDLNEAKEVVHTGFIKLWETRSNLSSTVSAKSYLYKIITNNCLDILKHEKVKLRYEKMILESSTNASAAQFEQVDIREMATAIDKAVAELPEQMRKIFELSRYEGLKYIAIAQHLNISVKTVETQMSRALIKLRQKLSHYLISLFLLSSFFSN